METKFILVMVLTAPSTIEGVADEDELMKTGPSDIGLRLVPLICMVCIEGWFKGLELNGQITVSPPSDETAESATSGICELESPLRLTTREPRILV